MEKLSVIKKIRLLNEETQNYFISAQEVLHVIRKEGYEAYIVGGAVRNLLMDLNVNDIDITTSASPDQVIHMFERIIPVGVEHGTVMVLYNEYSFEVTTFRTEGEYTDHRHPAQVNFVTDLREDLKRRDFTVNALALNHQFEVIDYFDGVRHIEEKRLCAVGVPDERFNEDALRMMRALRFKSVLSFKLDDATEKAIIHNAHLIQYVSIERIITEFHKLINGQCAEESIQLFYSSGLYKNISFFKEIKKTVNVNQPHSLEAFTALVIYKNRHLLSSIKLLKLSGRQVTEIKSIFNLLIDIEHHNDYKMLLYRYGIECFTKVMQLIGDENAKLYIHKDYIRKHRLNILNVKTAYNDLPIKHMKEIDVNGNDMMQMTGRKSGPWIKEELHKIELLILQGELNNKKNEIEEWIKNNVKI